MAYVSANQFKSNRVLHKHYVIHFRMTGHGKHLSINSYLLINFQCQKKKIGTIEDASDTAILGPFLGVFAKFMQLFSVIIGKQLDQCIH